jgi:hypothetical protein
MDARIEAGAMTFGVETPGIEVIVTVNVDLPVLTLVSLFNPASVLALLVNQGNSVTAVAPDYFSERKASGWALVA